MYVVTPRCAAAAAAAADVSALVLRRPTKEYTHPYSMMHRRLPTVGIEVAPYYHQLLVDMVSGRHSIVQNYTMAHEVVQHTEVVSRRSASGLPI